VPALINWPGAIKPGKVSAPVHIVDWMPTFCRLVGYKQEKDLKWDGRNIWPLITGQASQSKPRPLYWRHKEEALALRYGRWKLIVNGNVENAELYNLIDDPAEQQNLAEQYPKRVEELRALLIKGMKKDPL
jgi:arylsulfatase A-like enzyme